jgi:hypothetical protein
MENEGGHVAAEVEEDGRKHQNDGGGQWLKLVNDQFQMIWNTSAWDSPAWSAEIQRAGCRAGIAAVRVGRKIVKVKEESEDE